MTEYNPAEYWQQRGFNYSGSEPDYELEHLKKFINVLDISTMLEVGSGTGRVYNSLNRPPNFHMVDFVDSFRAECEKRTGIKPDKWDGKTLPYPDDSFELVISSSVFLHVPEKDIDNFILEHLRVAEKYVWIATCDSGSDYGPEEGHCIRHDYTSIFKRLGLTVATNTRDYHPLRRIYVLEK